MENELLGDELRRLNKEHNEAVEKFELLKRDTSEFLKNIARESYDFEAVIIGNLTGTPKLTIHLLSNWLIDQKLGWEIKENKHTGCNAFHVSWKP